MGVMGECIIIEELAYGCSGISTVASCNNLGVCLVLQFRGMSSLVRSNLFW
jgi:hypothetical protein